MKLHQPLFSFAFPLLAGLLFALPCFSQYQNLDQTLPRLIEKAGVPGISVAVIEGGRMVYSHAFGVRSADGTVPVDEQTVFSAASLSKPLLAFAVMQVVEEGKFDLDKPLSEYLDYEDLKHDPRYRQITARMVLSHSSGLPNWRNGRLEMLSDPGERFRYSGEGFVYLQKVMERITGQLLETMMQQKVFKPLGMERSSFIWQKSFEANFAMPHDDLGNVQSKTKPVEGNAAYSLQTTAPDYAKFVIALLNSLGMRKTAIDQMMTSTSKVPAGTDNSGIISNDLSWGLGWGLQQTADGKAFWHWGDNGTFKCFVIAFPEKKSGLVFFTNSSNGLSFANELVREALKTACSACGWIDYPRYDEPAFHLLRDILEKGFDPAISIFMHPNGKHQNTDLIPENAMNSLGYQLLAQKRPHEAKRIFQMNAAAFPNSANVWDSYGEACLRNGERDLAKEYYEKAFQMDPENKNAESIVKQLSPRIFGNTTFKMEGYSNAKMVALAGDFNDWNDTAMPFQRRDGEWTCTVELAPGTYKYKFMVDGVWIPDPGNMKTTEDLDHNSIIEVKGAVRSNTLASSTAAAQAASSPTKDVLAKYAEAAGGKEKWKELKTYIMTLKNAQGAGNVTLTMTMKKPNKYRIDLDNSSNRLVKSYNGTKGVISINYRTQDMGEGETQEMAEEVDFYDELLFAEEKGYTVDLLGKEQIDDDREAFKLRMTKPKGEEQIYYLDAQTFLPAMVVERSQDENFKGMLFKTVLSDYRTVEGLQFPFKITLLANDRVMWERQVDNIKVNPKVEDKVFEVK